MIIVCLSWIYIFSVCFLMGLLMRRACQSLLGLDYPPTIMEVLMIGIASLTVYAEYFSIIHRISIAAHILMPALCVFSASINKNNSQSSCSPQKRRLRTALPENT